MAWQVVAAAASGATLLVGVIARLVTLRRPEPEPSVVELLVGGGDDDGSGKGPELPSQAALYVAAAGIAAVGIITFALLARSIARRRSAGGCAAAGLQRATRHGLVLPSKDGLPSLKLDILVAGPPKKHRCGDALENPLVLYVLDPEPLLFGAAALFAFAQAGYFGEAEGTEEAMFRRLYVVGVGHSAGSFGLSGEGFDRFKLRSMRRRDFPPWNHPEVQPGGAANKHAHRLVSALAEEVAPFVEGRLLGLRPTSGCQIRRCLLGASYSACVALQSLLVNPTTFQHYVLGSPSVCFDPDILEEVRQSETLAVAAKRGVRVSIYAGSREREGTRLPGNVHNQMSQGVEQLCRALQKKGVGVDGVHELPGEDHSTSKMPMISRGLTAFARAQIL